MSATFTATVNLTDTNAETADMALAAFSATIDEHCIVKSARVDSFSSGRVQSLKVVFLAEHDAEAAQITRDAAASLPAYIAHDALRLHTWKTSPVRYIDL